MSTNTDTAVSEKDLNQRAGNGVTYENLPETLEDAIERLFTAEMHIEDLVRSLEIAEACGNYRMMTSFVDEAKGYLENKIKIIREDTGTMKITVIEDDMSFDEKLEASKKIKNFFDTK